MEFKGTQGKWEVKENKSFIEVESRQEFKTLSINIHLLKEYDDDSSISEENKANAKLIASAPELLKALVGVLNIVNKSTGVQGYHSNGEVAEWDEFDEIKYAETVIQKAIG